MRANTARKEKPLLKIRPIEVLANNRKKLDQRLDREFGKIKRKKFKFGDTWNMETQRG